MRPQKSNGVRLDITVFSQSAPSFEVPSNRGGPCLNLQRVGMMSPAARMFNSAQQVFPVVSNTSGADCRAALDSVLI